MESNFGAEFRSHLATWDRHRLMEQIADAKGRVKALIDGLGMMLFLKKKGGDDLFGTGEDGRVAFAQMRNPDADQPDGWDKDASFTCTNLSGAVRGEPSQTVFGGKDLDDLEVIEDPDDLIDMLLKGGGAPPAVSVRIVPPKNKPKVLKDKKES
jgi:hypothetical protein